MTYQLSDYLGGRKIIKEKQKNLKSCMDKGPTQTQTHRIRSLKKKKKKEGEKEKDKERNHNCRDKNLLWTINAT